MKTTKFLFLLLFVASLFTMASCGDDDKGTPEKKRIKYTYADVLKGLKDSKVEVSLKTFNLSDVIGVDNASNFSSGELQAGNYIKIEGLSAMSPSPVLKDFTLKVGGKSVLLGDCVVNPKTANEFASDETQSGTKFREAIQNVFNALVSKNKKADVTVSFTPSEDILESSNVKISIFIEADYNYVIY